MDISDFKVLNLNISRRLSAGQRKQLTYESNADILDAEWTVLALHTEPAQQKFERRIPLIFRPMFLRNLYGWMVALKLSRSHDVVLMRHIPYDPFAFIFAPLIRNRISIHHAKEAEELKLVAPGLRGRVASFLERLSGKFALRHVMGIAGVTREICEYEREIVQGEKPVYLYPNGIDVSKVVTLGDYRGDDLHAAFVCGKFSHWHGLDKLIDAVDEAQDVPLTIHLIGSLSESQIEQLNATERRKAAFKIHGTLTLFDYLPILSKCHFAFDSLAVDRKGLAEAATLKTRETLAAGLPMISGHKDTALPIDFPYYRRIGDVSIPEIVAIASAWKDVPRKLVAEAAAPFIDKSHIMAQFLNDLRSIPVTTPRSAPSPEEHPSRT